MALMEVKSLIFQLLLRYRLKPTDRTSPDMMASIAGFRLMPRELFWGKLESRGTA